MKDMSTQPGFAEKKCIIHRKNAENKIYIHRKKHFAMANYIYQHKDWTVFTWDHEAVNALFGEVRRLQGRISGKMDAIGFTSREERLLHTLTLDVVKSSEIEGEQLPYEQVRSSIARRLGIEIAGLTSSDRHIEGIVEIMVDATLNYGTPLTKERLFGWHAALFPTGYSGMYKIEVGRYRSGRMQVVSGAMGKEKIHYEAVEPTRVPAEMNAFLKWFNGKDSMDPVLKSAIAHFWFIIIHPFDDGNGRIARALSDMLLTRSEQRPERFYSMSTQIQNERKQYYDVLKKVQHSSGEITEWMMWFLSCLRSALQLTENTIQKIVDIANFWEKHASVDINERQRLMINKLFDSFEGKLKTSKWAKMTKCSQDTALRDIKDLIEKGILKQEIEGGRSTNYELAVR